MTELDIATLIYRAQNVIEQLDRIRKIVSDASEGVDPFDHSLTETQLKAFDKIISGYEQLLLIK
jgi:hypothetical protein